jgi:hypothetical protein
MEEAKQTKYIYPGMNRDKKEDKMSLQSERAQVLEGFQKLENSKKKSVRMAVDSIKDLRKQIVQMEDRGYPDNQVYKIKVEALSAIKKDLFENNQKELQELINTKNDLKKYHDDTYNKNYSQHERELASYKRKYAAMTLQELSAEASKYMEGKYPVDIDSNVIDELCISLKENKYNDKDFEGLRKWMKDIHYDESYMKNPLGENIENHITVLSKNIDNVVYEYDDINHFPTTIEDIEESMEYLYKVAENE